MAKASKLELLLSAKDKNLSSTVKAQIKLFKTFKRDADSLDKSLNKLFKQRKFSLSGQLTSEVRKANSEAQKLKKTFDSISKIKIKVNAPKIDTQKSSKNPSTPKQQETELDNLFDKKRKPKNKVERLARFNDNVIEPARQIKQNLKDEYDSLKKYTDETKKLYLAQAQFKLLNLSPEDNKRAFDAVTKSVRETGLTTRAEGVETITDLVNVFGNLNQALEVLPTASKYRFSMETLFGDKFDSGQIKEQIQNTSKFLELTGKVGKGREEMEKWFDVITRISSSTGGRTTGVDFLNMAKTGGTSVQNLTPEGLRNISAVMQELGGDRTGTSLMSMYQALVGGVMKQSAAERFDYFGLIDKSKIEYGKAQKIKKIQPGANALGDLMMEDPLKAADRLAEAFKTKGIDTNDSKAVNKELALLFQNRNAQRLMSILMNQRGQVLKESGMAENAKGLDGMFKLASEEELGKIKKFETALTELKTQVGVPLMEMGTSAASALMPIMKFFGDHPTIAKWTLYALGAAKALKLVSETASILSGTGGGIASLFSKTAENANGATSKVAGFTRELDKASNKTSAFQRAASSPITISLVTTGAILAIDTLTQMWSEAAEKSRQVAENSKTISQLYDNLMGRGMLYNAPGDYKGKEPEYDVLASKFFESIRRGGDLDQSFHPERASLWQRFSNPSPYGMSPNQSQFSGSQFSPDVAAKMWREAGITTSIQDPNVLARVLLQIQKGDSNLNFDDIKLLTTALEKVTSAEKIKTAQEILNGQPKTQVQQNIPFFPLPSQQFLPKANLPLPQQPSSQFFGGSKFAVGQLESSNKLNQIFTGLSQKTLPLGDTFSALNSKTSPLSDTFSGLNTKSNEANNAIGKLANSASGYADRINNLRIEAPKPVFVPYSVPMPNQSGSNNKQSSIVDDFLGRTTGRATGGNVQKGHKYEINEKGQEFFTPSQSGSVVANNILKKAGRSNENASAVNFSYNPTVIIGSGNENNKELLREVDRKLAIHKKEIEKMLSPRKITRKVAFAAERDSELA